MNPYDPVHDTINLLAGARPRRTPRPGECFDLPEPTHRPSPAWSARLLAYVRRIRTVTTAVKFCPAEGETYATPAP